MSNNMHTEVKQLIIDTLELEDIEVNEIVDSEPLFVEGLGLDSIDALELGIAIQKKYGIKMDAETQDTREYFASVNALVNFIKQNRH
ncbi:MAG: phosphopantetheine-binding protein [Gammaproteobacteria bacterium]|nr:phosphopantetheine-binding protein [Gammaproteobacteria bacterium]